MHPAKYSPHFHKHFIFKDSLLYLFLTFSFYSIILLNIIIIFWTFLSYTAWSTWKQSLFYHSWLPTPSSWSSLYLLLPSHNYHFVVSFMFCSNISLFPTIIIIFSLHSYLYLLFYSSWALSAHYVCNFNAPLYRRQRYEHKSYVCPLERTFGTYLARMK